MQHNLRNASVSGDRSGNTDAPGCREISNLGLVRFPNHYREGLARERMIEVYEGWFSFAIFHGMFAGDQPAHSALFPDVLRRLACRNCWGLSKSKGAKKAKNYHGYTFHLDSPVAGNYIPLPRYQSDAKCGLPARAKQRHENNSHGVAIFARILLPRPKPEILRSTR